MGSRVFRSSSPPATQRVEINEWNFDELEGHGGDDDGVGMNKSQRQGMENLVLDSATGRFSQGVGFGI